LDGIQSLAFLEELGFTTPFEKFSFSPDPSIEPMLPLQIPGRYNILFNVLEYPRLADLRITRLVPWRYSGECIASSGSALSQYKNGRALKQVGWKLMIYRASRRSLKIAECGFGPLLLGGRGSR